VKINHSAGLLSLDGSLNVSASLFGFGSNGSGGGSSSISSGSCFLGNLLFTELNIIVLTVILSEGGSINVHDSVLDQGLGSDQLIVSGVVDHVQESGTLGDLFGSPTEVAGVKF
jgi:hypothetical protein